jgi:hypothetical protein
MNTPAHEALVEYTVSDRTAGTAWNKLALWVYKRHIAGSTVNDISIDLALIEQEVKEEYEIDALPAAWRSAKSVALKACAKGIALVDGAGEPLGKTAIEKQCKDATPDKSGRDIMSEAWEKFTRAWTQYADTLSDAERECARLKVREWAMEGAPTHAESE